ncbi:hypothetical protein [Methylobacterium sp. Leaf108]|uniref:hypothetical protein n=1 Tax=Methylobacterium sp. Leaf108 TaxID=1736256 RepID=UPI0006FACCE3|nr:hypothetical protein [Methylobacterium sp. Leaf108]KQP55178.1 hypothetical protein ASF39_05540 [Methylobacterium sp. Leaf108]
MSLDANDPADTRPTDPLLPERDAAWDADRAALRARIAAAVGNARPHPIARHTLALLVEAQLAHAPVPADGSDAHDGSVEVALAAMRSRHPDLFLPPEPEPVPIAVEPTVAAKAPGPSMLSSLAPSPARLAAMTERGRALATAARSRLLTMGAAARTRLSRERPARMGPEAASAEPPSVAAAMAASTEVSPSAMSAPAPAVPPVSLPLADRSRRRGAGDLSVRAADRGRRTWYGLRDGLGDAVGPGGSLRRPSAVMALAAVACAGLLVVLLRGDGDRPSPAPAATPSVQTPAAETPPAAAQTPPASQPPSASARPQAAPPDDEPAPDDAPMQADVVPQAGEITGPAEVVDTATLKIGGRVVRLFGVAFVRGGQTEELTRYLGKRSVTCRPVAGSEAHLCAVDGRDLSEVVLFNGGGRASPEATPDLVAAEDRARTERLGVWAR